MPHAHTIPCSRCGRTVERTPLMVGGKEFTIARVLCDECAVVVESEILREREAQERLQRLQRWNVMCPSDYRELDSAQLPNAPLARVLSWKVTQGGRGLLLVGPPRVGKTRCAWLLVRRIFLDEAVPVVAVADTEFGHECMRLVNQTSREWMQRLCAARVLFLDDVGKAAPTERYRQELYHLIEQRTSWRRPTLVITNLNGQELSERISNTTGTAIAERLREFCDVICFDQPGDFQQPSTKETS